jgi:thiamine-monophosphate kinase
MVKYTKVASSPEVQFVDWLKRKLKGQNRGLVLGVGDDCAIVPGPDREDWLFTTDMLIEAVHFDRATHSAADAGWKALARGLSDIAAMGGAPRFCLVSLAIAPWTDRRWIAGFYRGLLAHGVVLAGGDLARTDRLMADIVVAGAVPRGKAMRRDGARAGHAIYVSGALGASALGLATRRGRAWAAHKRPQPRLGLGAFLREELHATAAIDLSDGLSLDLARLAAASGLEAQISMPPLFPGATREQALHGGEDYELLFTVPPRVRVPRAFRGVALTRIGTMCRGKAGLVKLDGERLPALGYDHLRIRHRASARSPVRHAK